jgi:hypothetical protein
MHGNAFVVVAAAAAALAVAAPAGGATPGLAQLPAGWTHAEVNVTINRVPHTITFDRGRVQSVSPAAITLREHDGSVVSVSVSPATAVKVDGRPGTLAELRRGFVVLLAMRIDGGPAKQLRVRVPPRLRGA